MNKIFDGRDSQDAIIWKSQIFSYLEIKKLADQYSSTFNSAIGEKKVVALVGAPSPFFLAVFLALAELRCIVIPFSNSTHELISRDSSLAKSEFIVDCNEPNFSLRATGLTTKHPLYDRLKAIDHPGLVFFTSGSAGQPRGIVHDFVFLFEKFQIPRNPKRVIAFMAHDHLGGINTIFKTLFNGGCLIIPENRTVSMVTSAIQIHGAQVLPTTPTFLNLALLSGLWEKEKLPSLEMITYGSEPMMESTLTKLHGLLPNVKLKQTYGTTETGVLSSISKSSDELWLKVGGPGYKTRIVKGLLEIKADHPMLGYLDGPGDFTEDGWYKTGDAIDSNDSWFRILGRQSEIINVGGEKVFPAEVENVIQKMPNVEQVVVTGESNNITGQIVKATVKLKSAEKPEEFRKKMRSHCKDLLRHYMIPQRVELTTNDLFGDRFKIERNMRSL